MSTKKKNISLIYIFKFHKKIAKEEKLKIIIPKSIWKHNTVYRATMANLEY